MPPKQIRKGQSAGFIYDDQATFLFQNIEDYYYKKVDFWVYVVIHAISFGGYKIVI